MKNIFRIFGADVKGLLTNFFALVIAVGLCALPALYAWFNILSILSIKIFTILSWSLNSFLPHP